MADWPVRPLRPDDVPHLRTLDVEIESSWALALEKETDGLATIWQLVPQRLEIPFRSTGFAPTPQEWMALERNLAVEAREGYAVDVQGQPVGFIELEVQEWREVGFIWNLLIHRPYRRQGIGTALMQATFAWGRERGLRALALETQTNNWDAIHFYRRMGFELCGIDDHFYTNEDVTAGEVAIFWYAELEGGDGG